MNRKLLLYRLTFPMLKNTMEAVGRMYHEWSYSVVVPVIYAISRPGQGVPLMLTVVGVTNYFTLAVHHNLSKRL